jgi:hypothetical protein
MRTIGLAWPLNRPSTVDSLFAGSKGIVAEHY